uniref:Cleavage and polyadenylation specificity factor subunit 3-II n=1 Tax=Rhizophora mucronata TaxID=61149 RepID=A0A2P2KNB4_RHIMU
MSIWGHIIVACVQYSTISHLCIKHCSSKDMSCIIGTDLKIFINLHSLL